MLDEETMRRLDEISEEFQDYSYFYVKQSSAKEVIPFRLSTNEADFDATRESLDGLLAEKGTFIIVVSSASVMFRMLARTGCLEDDTDYVGFSKPEYRPKPYFLWLDKYIVTICRENCLHDDNFILLLDKDMNPTVVEFT